jgi:hypothetical protein
MEIVLVGSPDDLCLHKAYASSLMHTRDPACMARARYIQAQLEVEAGCDDSQRRKMASRCGKLFKDHGKAWLGDLSKWLVGVPGYRVELKRGWLDTVEAPGGAPGFLEALVSAPEARLLRRLGLDMANEPELLLLAEAPFLDRLVSLRLGKRMIDQPAEHIRQLREGAAQEGRECPRPVCA